MAATSQMPLGTLAPEFTLPDPDGREVASRDFDGAPALLVAFLAEHCPYVKHVREGLKALARDLAGQGVAVIGINANDWDAYPDDAPERMPASGYPFPYLVDETQQVAKAYGALCTPDFFLFDAERRLAYRGQMDGSRPGKDVPVTGEDLRAAVGAVLAGEPVPAEQYPSVGCSIKWRPGNAPDYA